MDTTGTLRLPHHLSSASIGRRKVAEDLGARGVPSKLAADVELVLSELVGNSVRHACALDGGELEISWQTRHDGVELRVTDGGSEVAPAPRAVGIDDVSGRGLSIVAKVAAAWGVETSAVGTTVWALVSGGGRKAKKGRLQLA